MKKKIKLNLNKEIIADLSLSNLSNLIGGNSANNQTCTPTCKSLDPRSCDTSAESIACPPANSAAGTCTTANSQTSGWPVCCAPNDTQSAKCLILDSNDFKCNSLDCAIEYTG